MARSRVLKPGFFQNEVLAELPFEGRLLFAGLWLLADREGRLEDRPKRIKAALFPWDDVAIDDLLAGLAERGFITRYQVEAVAVIQIVKFSEHQNPHSREAASALPRLCLDTTKAMPSPAVSISVSTSVSKTVSKDSSEPPAASAEPVVMVYPCIGKAGAQWCLKQSRLGAWEGIYLNLDVLAECRKAHAWIMANPNRRKTVRGMETFLVSWLNRATDRRTGEDRREYERRQKSYAPTTHADYDRWPQECREIHDGECGNYEAHRIRVFRDAQERASA